MSNTAALTYTEWHLKNVHTSRCEHSPVWGEEDEDIVMEGKGNVRVRAGEEGRGRASPARKAQGQLLRATASTLRSSRRPHDILAPLHQSQTSQCWLNINTWMFLSHLKLKALPFIWTTAGLPACCPEHTCLPHSHQLQEQQQSPQSQEPTWHSLRTKSIWSKPPIPPKPLSSAFDKSWKSCKWETESLVRY